MRSVPLCGPTDVGAKRTVTVCCPPAFTVKGVEGETIVKRGLSRVIPVTVKGAFPTLRTVSVRSASNLR
jgi:hypothetical protein